jgi:hypothetical protein
VDAPRGAREIFWNDWPVGWVLTCKSIDLA